VGAGYAFNPIQNATQTILAGDKKYWYVVLLTKATTISGFQVFCSTSSADYLRVGIYRGALKGNASGSITLVGQDSGGAPTIGALTNIDYCRRAITAQSGQNLSFAAGEFMTIAFHSNGSNNVFYASANTAATNTQHAYLSTANYANTGGFPASLTGSHVGTALATKLCFELY
jgi:hypothetical protein